MLPDAFFSDHVVVTVLFGIVVKTKELKFRNEIILTRRKEDTLTYSKTGTSLIAARVVFRYVELTC